jgi:hypothetical protein
LVGSSHFFVDTTNNRVGITTADPDAGLHVNSNAYVHTDFRVGTGIAMNVTSGRITAGSFDGDGSLLSGVNSDSGSWVNGSSSNIHLAVSTDNVGIGVLNPSHKLDVDGDINIATGSTLRVGGTPAVFSNWSVDGSDIYRSSGNVGIVTATPMTKLDIECNAAQPSIVFSDTSNSRYQTGIGSIHISGQGQRLDFYTGDSGANGTLLTNSPRMSITGTGNVGIGESDPESILHVQSDVQSGTGGPIKKTAATASTSQYNYILNGPRAGTTSGGAVHFINGSSRDDDGGASTYTMRNDSGNTRVGNSSYSTIIAGTKTEFGESAKRNLFFHPPEWGYNTTSTSDTTLWSFTYNFPYDGYVILNTNGHWRNTSYGTWFYGKLGIDHADPADTSGFYDSYTGGAQSSHGGDFHEYEENANYWGDFNWGGTLKVSAGNRVIGLRVRISGGHLYINGTAINMFYIPTKIF